jgi:hypothetical protein
MFFNNPGKGCHTHVFWDIQSHIHNLKQSKIRINIGVKFTEKKMILQRKTNGNLTKTWGGTKQHRLKRVLAIIFTAFPLFRPSQRLS